MAVPVTLWWVAISSWWSLSFCGGLCGLLVVLCLLMGVPTTSCDIVLPLRTLPSSTTVSCSITPKLGQSLPVKGTRWVWVLGSWCGVLLPPTLYFHGVPPFLLLPCEDSVKRSRRNPKRCWWDPSCLGIQGGPQR